MPLEYDDITPTEEQYAILDAFEAGAHLAVTALAGTGKTSTLRMCGETIRRKHGIYLAFNRAIADEASESFPMRVEAKTAHSFAYRALGYSYAHRLNGKRLPPWEVAKMMKLKGISTTSHDFKPARVASLVREMVARFCYTSDPQITLDHVPFVRGLETRYDPDTDTLYPDEHGELALELLPHANAYWKDIVNPRGSFRFEHDHYLKIWALTHPKLKGDFMLVDEAQDLNGVLVGLVEDQEHMQLVIVGDSNQQIYEWRGSLNAMTVFDTDLTLPLTQSWRFGPEVAEVANLYLAELGSNLRIRGNPAKTSFIGDCANPDAVLCRTNGGGLDMALGAQERGMSVHFAGNRPREILSFCEAVAKMQQHQITTHPDLQAFSTWDQVLTYTKSTNDPDFKLMVSLIEKYTVETLIKTINDLVPLKSADLTISTGHSAKGLEWDKVRIGADFADKYNDTERIITPAEYRLRYVSVTRAKSVLDPGPLIADIEGENDDRAFAG